MKYFKSLFFIIIFSSVSQGAYVYEQTNDCVDDFYINGKSLYYKVSGTTVYTKISTTKYVSSFIDGFDYNATSKNCEISQSKKILGIATKEYNFLLGLMGVIIGGIFMFFSIDAFIKVGGKK